MDWSQVHMNSHDLSQPPPYSILFFNFLLHLHQHGKDMGVPNWDSQMLTSYDIWMFMWLLQNSLKIWKPNNLSYTLWEKFSNLAYQVI
jgi:hypothetical protein